jgi:hypothetical protein
VKKNQITAAAIHGVARKLRAAEKKAKCYICHKPDCDGFSVELVRIHMRCSRKRKEDFVKQWNAK